MKFAVAPPLVAVLGGGAAGFFGAIACAEANPDVSVILLEKTGKLLAKVRVSGGGRCNVTHACETPAQLVPHLANANGWWRDTAQLLLVSRHDTSVAPALMKMANTHKDPNARIHAMWTLQGLDALPKETVVAATKHGNPRVRRAAVQLAEAWLIQKDTDIQNALKDMSRDVDAQVVAQIFLAWRAAGISAPAEITDKPNAVVAALVSQDKAEKLASALGESGKKGKEIYETLCTACHGPDGKGVQQGDKVLAPALAKSEWFKNNGNVEILARIVLKGQTGPINGVSYGEVSMLPLELTYTDEQLASVLNFVGERWHGWVKPVEGTEIAGVRKAIADRATPWTHDELKNLSGKTIQK